MRPSPPRRRLAAWAEPLALFLVALAVRAAFQWDSAASVGLDTTRVPEFDQNTFHVWAARIADGDVLSRDMIHPFHSWARVIATEAEWNSWYGEKTFHQAPLFPYVAGLLYAVFGKDPRAVYALHAILGALTAVLAWRVGRRLFSPAAGRVAGLAVAFCGPLVFMEGELLREPLMAFLLLLFVDAAETARERGTRASYLALGTVLALNVLTKPTALLLLPVPFAIPFLAGRRESPAADRPALLAFAVLGLAIPFAPVVARNLAVGAAALSIETRGPEAFVAGNAEGSTGVHWFPPETREKLLYGHARRILHETRDRLLPTIVATLATHAERPFGYVELLAAKAAAVVNDYEPPNNENFALMRSAVGALRVPFVTFGWIVPFALPGIVLALRGWRRNLPLLAVAVTGLLVPVAFYVISRFRLPAVPALAVLGGAHAVFLARTIAAAARAGASARTRAGAAALLAVSGALAVFARPDPKHELGEAFATFHLARQFQSYGDVERSDRLLARAVTLAPDNLAIVGEALFRRGGNAIARGDAATAREAYERFLALESDPRVSRLKPSMKSHSRIGLGRAALLEGDAARGAREFEAAARVALTISPPEIDLLRECAVALESVGSKAAALEVVKALRAFSPGDPDAIERENRLGGGG